MVDDGDRRFKYMRTQATPVGYGEYSGCDYGVRNQGIMCVNAEQIVHDDLASKPDVFQFPVDLTGDVPANELQPLRNELNSRGYPSLWVTSPAPYQGVVRNIVKACQVLQTVQRYNSDLFGDDLSARGIDLSLEKRAQIQSVASHYGATIDNSNSLEITLKDLMESVPTIDPRSNAPISLFGLVL
jgi:hypothetical protein